MLSGLKISTVGGYLGAFEESGNGLSIGGRVEGLDG
jgi:hypothetical protein